MDLSEFFIVVHYNAFKAVNLDKDNDNFYALFFTYTRTHGLFVLVVQKNIEWKPINKLVNNKKIQQQKKSSKAKTE